MPGPTVMPFFTANSLSGRENTSGGELLRRDWLCLAAGLSRRHIVVLGQYRFEGALDLGKLGGLLHLMAEKVLDVEDIDDLFAIGRDFGARDLQIEPGQLAGQLIEQARPVAAIDLDHRVRGA